MALTLSVHFSCSLFCQADHYLAETKAFVSQAAELKSNSTILEQQNKDLKKKVDQIRAVVKRLHDMRSALASDKVRENGSLPRPDLV